MTLMNKGDTLSSTPNDRYRPRYHFTAPKNWINDPNGLVQWNGTYHLYYQHNPNAAYWADMHWGHATSTDLMSWTHEPIVLAPDPDGPDADGVYSGCAVVVDGEVTFVYTGVKGDDQLPCIARPLDENLEHLEKDPSNPVIASPPPNLRTTIFRDHSIFQKDELWYHVIGSGIEGEGGNCILYTSSDFKTWTPVGTLVDPEKGASALGERVTGWECPDFFEQGDDYALIVSHWNEEGPLTVTSYVGGFDGEKFSPASQAVFDPGISFYAPQSFSDESGRRIQFGWMRENRAVSEAIAQGWSGTMSLPRELTIIDGQTLGVRPADDVFSYRGHSIDIDTSGAKADLTIQDDSITGNCCLLELELDQQVDGVLEIGLLVSDHSGERTRLVIDASARTVTLDTTGSSSSEHAYGSVATVKDVVPSRIQVFVDASVIEVFIDDRLSVTGRAYPVADDADRVTINGSSVTKARLSSMEPVMFSQE